jgi:aspartate aminotransferase
MLAAGYNKEYLPIEGLEAFRQATVQLLLGADHPAIKEGRVAVLQVGRSGSNRFAGRGVRTAWRSTLSTSPGC